MSIYILKLKNINVVLIIPHLQVSGRVQSREYTKKIGEEEVERRVAYEVSVSKIDLVEDEE